MFFNDDQRTMISAFFAYPAHPSSNSASTASSLLAPEFWILTPFSLGFNLVADSPQTLGLPTGIT